LLEAGEQSGRLPESCRLLAENYEARARLLRSFIGYLVYPVLLLHFAVFLFPINLLTGVILRGEVTAFLVQKAMILLPAYALVALLVYLSQARHGEGWRAVLEAFAHPVPLLGKARRSMALARLSAALEALLNAGVPIVRAWELSAEASGSPALRRTVHGFLPRIETGSTPAEEISKRREFPDLFASQYHSGEISGQLDETMRRLHLHYQDEGARWMRMAVMAGAGMVYGGVMLIIAWQVISFWLGYYGQINDVLQ
jgi:type II secretory pathway component PulF